jgi:hypothetical protein
MHWLLVAVIVVLIILVVHHHKQRRAIHVALTGFGIGQDGSLTITGHPHTSGKMKSLVGRKVALHSAQLGTVLSTVAQVFPVTATTPVMISFSTAAGSVPGASSAVFQDGDTAVIY